MTENKQNSLDSHYDLDDDQVEALVSAIEASPITSNGETSEVAIQAALFLTGDRPADREQDFIDVLVEVDDVSSLEKERAAFARILADFAASTEGENAPQVLQTKQRLARIVSLLEQSIQYLNKSPPPASKTLAGDKKTDGNKSTANTSTATKQQRSAEESVGKDGDDDENDEQATSSAVKSCSIFDANWFRFAAFSIVAVVLLLAVVALIQWLRKKYENDEKEQQQQQQQQQQQKQQKSADAGAELLKDSGSIML